MHPDVEHVSLERNSRRKIDSTRREDVTRCNAITWPSLSSGSSLFLLQVACHFYRDNAMSQYHTSSAESFSASIWSTIPLICHRVGKESAVRKAVLEHQFTFLHSCGGVEWFGARSLLNSLSLSLSRTHTHARSNNTIIRFDLLSPEWFRIILALAISFLLILVNHVLDCNSLSGLGT